MMKAEAENECLRRWRALPKQQRSTNDQATTFARSLLDDIDFSTSGDRFHFIEGWLQRDLALRGWL